MISKIIHDYLLHDKRITVPGFGSFIRKENGQIAFVEILRADDGVLSSLVRKQGGYTEVEAAAVIDRFIFEIKHALQTRGSIRIKGIGAMSMGSGGKIVFQSESAPQNVSVSIEKEKEPQVAAVRSEQKAKKPAEDETRQSRQRKNTSERPRKSNKKRTDTLLIVAIIMAAIALAVMIYGFSVSGAPQLNLIP